jgi:signal peptidase I
MATRIKNKKRKAESHPWRENIEALTIAVVVALLFKFFILEISKIPSGSMQPTLMGNPETQVFDRVLVDKLSMHFRDPKRFEVVVFKHPLERSRIMVKRLVGMPGEEFRIAHGDLWTRPDAEAPWKVLRRPAAVQEEMWKPLDVDDPPRSSWSKLSGGEGWVIDGREVHGKTPGRLQFRDSSHIRDRYLDGYPDALRNEIRSFNPNTGKNYVGDLRVSGEIRAEASLEWLLVTLTEGLHGFEFRIPGPAGAPDAVPEIRARGLDPAGEEIERAEAWRMREGRRVSFAVENLDDRLSLEIDGEVVASLEIPSAPRQEASVLLELTGGGGQLEDLQVERDVYYVPQNGISWEVEIPEGHYVMLGDNTQDSADGRDWKAMRYSWTDESGAERSVRGNFRTQGENPTPGVGREGEAFLRFRDEWGERHWFARAASKPAGPAIPQKVVPRELILGRAMAIFWPIKPIKGLWRLGWLP